MSRGVAAPNQFQQRRAARSSKPQPCLHATARAGPPRSSTRPRRFAASQPLQFDRIGRVRRRSPRMPLKLGLTSAMRILLTAALAALALPLAAGGARAAYPERTITLIVPFPAGGPTDII